MRTSSRHVSCILHSRYTTIRMNFGSGYQSFDSNMGGGRTFGGGTSRGGYGGGGGYMPSTMGGGGFGSPGIEQSPTTEGRRKVVKNQSIRPLTSSQLQQASVPSGDEPFRIDNEDVGQISLVGEIVEVQEMPTNITYKLDDRTGPLIEVRRWINDEDSPLELQRRAACREGIYVKVIGHLRVFNKQQSVIGFYIKPIEDFNEVTHHLAETLHSHLAFTKGVSVPKEFADLKMEQFGDNWAPNATSTQVGGTSRGASYSTRIDSGLTPIQRQVLTVISQTRSDHGLHVAEIIASSKAHGHSEPSIRNALDFLCNEGHIYSTIDDEHYKSTEDYF